MREVRRIAALLRRGAPVTASKQLVRLAETHLRNRAQYNARRQRVRDAARKLRGGKNVRVAKDIATAVENHLQYRDAYNADRVAKRAAERARPATTSRRRRPSV